MAEVRPLNEVYTANAPGSNAYRGIGKSNTGYTTDQTNSAVRNVAVTRTDNGTGRRVLNAATGTFETVTDPRNQNKRNTIQGRVSSGQNVRRKQREDVSNTNNTSFTPNSIGAQGLQRTLGSSGVSGRAAALTGSIGNTTLVDRAKITRISLINLSWVITVWLTIQIPFALISLVSLGAGIILAGGGQVIDVLLTPVNFITKNVAGVDISVESFASDLAGETYFIILILLLALALLQVLVLALQYLISGFNPVFGTGGGFKFIALCFVCIGFFVPLLNLFPWILLYMAAMWIYPK